MSVRHVRLLAVLQMLQGQLECAGGLIFGLSPGGTGPPGSSPAIWVGLSLAGLGLALVGALRFCVGLLNMFYLGRRLGIGALLAGLLSAVTCCCLPTSLALCAYGLRVYTDDNVRRAFALRAAGASLDQIERTLA